MVFDSIYGVFMKREGCTVMVRWQEVGWYSYLLLIKGWCIIAACVCLFVTQFYLHGIN